MLKKRFSSEYEKLNGLTKTNMITPGFLFLLIIVCAFSGKTVIELNIEPQTVYEYYISSEQLIKRGIKGEIYNEFNEAEFVIAFSLESKQENERYNVKAWYKKLNLLIESNYSVIEMNSHRAEGDDIMDHIVRNMIDKPFFLEISSQGEIKEISGLDLMYHKALESMDFLNNEAKQNLTKSLDLLIGRTALEGNFEMMGSFYPTSDVQIGDIWQNKIKQNRFIQTDLVNKYHLKKVDENIYHVQLSTDFDQLQIKAPFVSKEKENIPVHYILSGDQNGTVKIDRNTGWFIEGMVEQNFKGFLNINQCRDFPQGFECPVNYELKIRCAYLD